MEKDKFNYRKKSYEKYKKNNYNIQIYNNIRESNSQNDINIFISYKSLRELLNKDNNNIINFFMKYKNLSQVFENTKFTQDMVYLMLELLVRITNINNSFQNILNQIIEKTSFVERNIKTCLDKMKFSENNYLKFLNNVIELFKKLLDKSPNLKKGLKYGELWIYSSTLKSLIDQKYFDINIDNLELTLKIMNNIRILKEKEEFIKLKQYQEKINPQANEMIILDGTNNNYKEKKVLLNDDDFKKILK